MAYLLLVCVVGFFSPFVSSFPCISFLYKEIRKLWENKFIHTCHHPLILFSKPEWIMQVTSYGKIYRLRKCCQNLAADITKWTSAECCLLLTIKIHRIASTDPRCWYYEPISKNSSRAVNVQIQEESEYNIPLFSQYCLYTENVKGHSCLQLWFPQIFHWDN